MKPTLASVASHDHVPRRGLLAMLLCPLVASWVLAGCEQPAASRTPAPVFRYTLLDGSAADSSALRGKVVLVNFWATTCAVCVNEMPQLIATHLKFRPLGLHTLAIAVRHDPPALVADFAQSRALPFDVVIDNTGAITESFGDVRGTPTTYVIDRQGRIATRIEGKPDFKQLHALIDQLLAPA